MPSNDRAANDDVLTANVDRNLERPCVGCQALETLGPTSRHGLAPLRFLLSSGNGALAQSESETPTENADLRENGDRFCAGSML